MARGEATPAEIVADGNAATVDIVAALAVPFLADWCVVYSVDDDGRLQIETVAHHDPAKSWLARDFRRTHLGAGEHPVIVEEVCRTLEPKIISTITDERLVELARDEAHLAALRALAPRSMMVVPVRGHGRTLGAISFLAAESGRRYGPADLVPARHLANQAALVLENARLSREALAAERRLRDLMEGIDGIVWEADAETLRFTFASQPAERLLGYPLEQWSSDPAFCAMLIHSGDRQRVLDECRSAVREGRDHEIEFRAVAADGRTVLVRNIVRIVYDGQGRPARLRGLMIDVTEHHRAIRAIDEAQGRLRAVISNSPVVIFALDRDGVVTFADGRGMQSLRITSEEVIGRSALTIYPDVPSVAEDMRRALSGEAFTTTVDLDGIAFEVSLSPMQDEGGEITGVIGVATDVTDRRRTEKALHAAEGRFRTAFESAPIGTALADLDGELFLVNEAFCRLLGRAREDLLEASLVEMAPPEDRDRSREMLARLLTGGGGLRIEQRFVHADGHVVWVQMSCTLATDLNERPLYIIAQVENITEGRRAEDALRESEERYRELFENANDIVYTHDLLGNFTSINQAGERIVGYAREEALTMSIASILVPESLEAARQAILRKVAEGGPTTYEVEITAKEGHRVPLEVSTRIIYKDGAPVGVQGIARDITERRAQTAALEHQALHDGLTGLPNRTLLGDRVEQAILAGQRENVPLALLLMDLDNFKQINDTLGHHKGDRLLQEIGPRMRAALRESDTVARFGGDEFAVLLPGTGLQGATLAARKILRALERPFQLEDLTLEIGASLGIALFPEHGGDANTLVQRADVAMYVAKQNASGFAVYASEQDQHSPRRLALIGDLRVAVESDQLQLHYQPTVDLRTGRLTGVEALARWRHPERGPLLPDQFIPLAEQSGLIKALTLRVLQMALRQSRAWLDAGIRLGLSVNVSARMLQDPGLPGSVGGVLAACGVLPSSLTLEITESAIMADPARAMDVLARLSRMGVRLSIDDFGTGYSSLIHLKRLPVNEIKIDKTFIINLASDPSDAAISRSTIDLGHNLGLKVVAEGVESREALGAVVALGCDIAQGNFIAAPMPPEEVPGWIQTSPWGKRRVIDLVQGEHPTPSAKPQEES